MKKTNFYFIIFSILFVFSACRDTLKTTAPECLEEGKYYGLKELTERSDSFWTYEPNQVRVYISNGQEHLLEESMYQSYQEEIIETPLNYLCTWANIEPEYDYADLEHRRVTYRSTTNPSASIALELDVRTVFSRDSIYFVDAMKILTTLYQDFTIDNRNTPDDNIFHPHFDFIADTTVLGKRFQNVYYNRNRPLSVLYTKEEGVVMFKDSGGNIYVLDRIE